MLPTNQNSIMEYDKSEWRAMRNDRLAGWVDNAAAVTFILDVGLIAEVWDDLVDGDKVVVPSEINKAFLLALVGLQMNPFYESHRQSLVPMMLSGMNAWIDSTYYEKSSDVSQKAFAYVLRDWYVEIILLVIAITRGLDVMRNLSLEVRAFFTHDVESFDEYTRGLL